MRSGTTSTATLHDSGSSGTPPTNATEPLVTTFRSHDFLRLLLRAPVRVAYFPAADLRNSFTIVSVHAPVAALALLGAVPDPTSRTSTTPFLAAGGADRRRDGRFLFGGGRRAALGGGALVGLGARRAVGVDEGVLLGALAHGALAHC